MRTRRGSYYPSPSDAAMCRGQGLKRGRDVCRVGSAKRQVRVNHFDGITDDLLVFIVNHFDGIPDDLLVSILAKLSSSAGCPAEFINVLLTRFGCKSCLVCKGHIDALREPGHCLQDGYGITKKNVVEGRRFLVQANARELASIYPPHYWKAQHLRFRPSFEPWLKNLNEYRRTTFDPNDTYALVQGCPLLSDFGCNVPPPELHPAVKFLVNWFDLHPPSSGLRLCSHRDCGRPETRKHEFRRCSVCGTVNYCSRACQALDWKIRHKHNCFPIDDWLEPDDDDDDDLDQEDEEFV